MKVLEAGHVYVVEQVEPKAELQPQIIRFIRRSSKLITHPYEQEGTITQEILRVAIDRTKYLDAIQTCIENQDTLYHLRSALLNYEARAYRRKQQKVNNGLGVHEEGDERKRDVPFDVVNDIDGRTVYIEELPIGEDGHIVMEDQT